MGWASGSSLMSCIIDSLKDTGPLQRLRIYLRIIPCFESEDCDTLGECMGVDQAYDDAMQALHPDWFKGGECES